MEKKLTSKRMSPDDPLRHPLKKQSAEQVKTQKHKSDCQIPPGNQSGNGTTVAKYPGRLVLCSLANRLRRVNELAYNVNTTMWEVAWGTDWLKREGGYVPTPTVTCEEQANVAWREFCNEMEKALSESWGISPLISRELSGHDELELQVRILLKKLQKAVADLWNFPYSNVSLMPPDSYKKVRKEWGEYNKKRHYISEELEAIAELLETLPESKPSAPSTTKQEQPSGEKARDDKAGKGRGKGNRGARPSRDAKLDKKIYEARNDRGLSYPELAREFFGDESKTREIAKAIDSHRHKLKRMGQ